MNAKSIFQANTLAHTTSPFRVNVINEKSILNKSRKGRTRKIVCLTIWHSNRRNEINHRPCMGRERSSLWMLFLCSLAIIIEINHFTTHSHRDPQTDPPFLEAIDAVQILKYINYDMMTARSGPEGSFSLCWRNWLEGSR